MDIISSLIKVLLDSALTPAIILTSSNYKSVISFLEESKINSSQVILIDTVSKAISRVSDKENIYFLDSLRNLTQIQIKLVNLLKSKKNVCFIFDSLNVLELYHSDDVLMKFIYSSTKILHKYGANGYYIINSIKILPKIAQSFDNIFKLEKVE